MSKISILDKTKKKKIIAMLEKEYGIEDLKHLFILSGNDKIRIYSGDLSREELNYLGKKLKLELIGSSLGKMENDSFRLSFDVANLPQIKEQIDKNIIEINEEQKEKWMVGDSLDMEIDNKSNFVVLKNNDDFLGVAKNRKTFIQNYVPKERRIK